MAVQKLSPLRAGEDAAVETGQGNPLGGPPSCIAEGLERVFASLEMGDQVEHGVLAHAGEAPDELDDEVQAWIRESYRLMGMRERLR